jgi:glyoxylase I family protein
VADQLRDELLALERALAERDWTAAALDELIDEDFVEVGRSGRAWDRAAILDLLAGPPDRDVRIADFAVTRLGGDVVLATYSTTPDPALRASLWIRRDGRWRIRFHQGTPRAGKEPGAR